LALSSFGSRKGATPWVSSTNVLHQQTLPNLRNLHPPVYAESVLLLLAKRHGRLGYLVSLCERAFADLGDVFFIIMFSTTSPLLGLGQTPHHVTPPFVLPTLLLPRRFNETHHYDYSRVPKAVQIPSVMKSRGQDLVSRTCWCRFHCTLQGEEGLVM